MPVRALAAVLVLAAAAGCSKASDPAAKTPPAFDPWPPGTPAVGAAAPGFELRDTDGNPVRLADAVARGPVVLVSGSFSCPLFRMKAPRFEALARRFAGKATVYVVYGQEAHPKAKSGPRLQGFADSVRGLDADHDGSVTVAEYGAFGPRFMYDAFDVDHDGVVRSHEIIAAARIDQFATIDEPRTYEERVALARRFRAEVPGAIPILVDPLENPTAKVYGDLPNFAYVIGGDGRITLKLAWAAARDVERELARLTGEPPPVANAPDLAPIAASLAAAKASGRGVLVELVAPGCAACKAMDDGTLADPEVKQALAGYEVVRLGVEQDPAWRLLEDLELGATPAFVKVAADGTVGARLQGAQDKAAFLAFLSPPAAP